MFTWVNALLLSVHPCGIGVVMGSVFIPISYYGSELPTEQDFLSQGTECYYSQYSKRNQLALGRGDRAFTAYGWGLHRGGSYSEPNDIDYKFFVAEYESSFKVCVYTTNVHPDGYPFRAYKDIWYAHAAWDNQSNHVLVEGNDFISLEEAYNAFMDYVVRDRWIIRYIPINCSIRGDTEVAGNTEVSATVTPYPNSRLVGTSVYYSGGTIRHALTGNILTFTTPPITETEE